MGGQPKRWLSRGWTVYYVAGAHKGLPYTRQVVAA